LHTLGCIEHTSDNALAGNERTGNKSDKDAPVEADRMSSDGSDLGEQMDQLSSDESDDNRARSDDGFEVDMTEHPDYLEQDDARGNEQSTTHVAGDNRSEGQPSSEQLAASEQAATPEIRHGNVVNAEIRHEDVVNAEIRHECHERKR
jgi:hypothetical protein